MRIAVILICLFLVLGVPLRADTLYLPLLRGGPVVTVTGTARWEPDIGPVAHRRLALLKVICDDPLVFRHTSDSPHARTNAEGRFAFQSVPDGRYVLAIEDRPPFGWRLLWQDTTLCLVVVEGQSVEMGIVRVGTTHQWGESYD